MLAGREWITFEWLFQVLCYLAHLAGGALGITCLKVLTLAAAFLLFFRLAGGGFWAGIMLSFAALVLRVFFFARPQIFDYLLMGLYLDVLERSPQRPERSAFALPLLQVLWVNLHGGAALVGAGIVGLRALSSRRSAWAWAGLAAACAAAMLLNPHGLKIFSHTQATLTFPGKEQISEWAPLRSFLSWEGLFLALGAAAIAASWKADAYLCLLALVLGVMGVVQNRHMSLAILAVAPLAARTLQRLRPVPLRLRSAVLAVGCMALLSGGFILSHLSYLTNVGKGLEDLPDRAIQYLDKNGVEGRMFHSYNMGGYLIWKTWPRRKVFVDGRNVEYGPRFINEAIHWYVPKVWEQLDAEWKFDYALLSNSPFYRAAVLDASADWALVFWDDAALVYLKRTPRNAALIARDAYRWLKPNQMTFAYLGDYARERRKAEAALAEVDRALASSDLNVNAVEMRAYLLEGLGRDDEALRDLESAVERFALKPGPYISLGMFYEKTGDAAAARRTYERGIRIAQWAHDLISLAYLYNNLGVIELKEGDYAKA